MNDVARQAFVKALATALLRAGGAKDEVAVALGISVRTIERYVAADDALSRWRMPTGRPRQKKKIERSE